MPLQCPKFRLPTTQLEPHQSPRNSLQISERSFFVPANLSHHMSPRSPLQIFYLCFCWHRNFTLGPPFTPFPLSFFCLLFYIRFSAFMLLRNRPNFLCVRLLAGLIEIARPVRIYISHGDRHGSRLFWVGPACVDIGIKI